MISDEFTHGNKRNNARDNDSTVTTVGMGHARVRETAPGKIPRSGSVWNNRSTHDVGFCPVAVPRAIGLWRAKLLADTA